MRGTLGPCGGEAEGQPERRPREAGQAVSGSEDGGRDHKPESAGSLRSWKKQRKRFSLQL